MIYTHGPMRGQVHTVEKDLLLFDYRRYDHIKILRAHTYPNLAVFVRLCLARKIGITLVGEPNKYFLEAVMVYPRM